jgi:hypothetical protein
MGSLYNPEEVLRLSGEFVKIGFLMENTNSLINSILPGRHPINSGPSKFDYGMSHLHRKDPELDVVFKVHIDNYQYSEWHTVIRGTLQGIKPPTEPEGHGWYFFGETQVVFDNENARQKFNLPDQKFPTVGFYSTNSRRGAIEIITDCAADVIYAAFGHTQSRRKAFRSEYILPRLNAEATEIPISEVMTARTSDALANNGVYTLAALAKKNQTELLKWRDMGKSSILECGRKLRALGIASNL